MQRHNLCAVREGAPVSTNVNIATDGPSPILTDVFSEDVPVYLAFSGGKDSLALLRLCEPYKGRFKLLWANTGFTFPHIERIVREKGADFGLVELKSDLPAIWQQHGLPAETLSMSNWLTFEDPLRLQPRTHCCTRAKGHPLLRFMDSHGGPAILLMGTRRDDGHVLVEAENRNAAGDSVRIVSPIADWTADDVMKFIAKEGIELPAHYDRIADSLDCWSCPANWALYGREYVDLLERELPGAAEFVLPAVSRNREALQAAMARLDGALQASAQYRRARPLQRDTVETFD
jgi:3'-phosphoadenosine 5'-phosphosulfate sulfotransferase (PAPS reductase)/FAD synthetase